MEGVEVEGVVEEGEEVGVEQQRQGRTSICSS